MKKRFFVLLLAGITIAALSGCGKDNKEQGSALSETESADSPVDISGSDYVKLADYKNLSAVKNIYTVTDEAVQAEIQSTLSSYADYQDVERAAREGDYVTINFTGSVGGNVVMDDYAGSDGSEEDAADDAYEIILGDAEYGEEFDKALIGASAGDSRDFSVTYTEENAADNPDLENYIGDKVDYHVDVVSISEEILPEYDDAFVKENIDGFSTRAEFEQDLRNTLEEEYTQTSDSELQEELIGQVVEGSTIEGYPDELYDMFRESVLSNYQSFAEAFGQSVETDEVMDMFGLTEDDVKTEALDALNRYLVISAIAEKETISVSDQEFDKAAAQYAADYEYDDTASFLKDYGEDNVRDWVLEEKVLDFLEENANITEQDAEYPTDDM